MRADNSKPVTYSDVRAWRDGYWVLVSIHGEVVCRRLTRDFAFTRADIIFLENQSPLPPRTLENFRRVELGGNWASPKYFYKTNRFSVPIESN